MRWRIRDILELVVLVALALSAYQFFYARSGLQWQFVYAVYLLTLSIATLAAVRVSPRLQHFWQGYAVFGWIYFIFFLQNSGAQHFQSGAVMGMVFALITAIAAHLFLPPKYDSKNDNSTGK